MKGGKKENHVPTIGSQIQTNIIIRNGMFTEAAVYDDGTFLFCLVGLKLLL